MVEKELKVKISTLTDIKDLEDLESKLKELQDTKLKVGLDADTTRLEEVSSEIEDTKSTLSDLKGKVDVDNSELESLESELSELEAEQLQLMVNLEYTDLDDVEARIDELQQKQADIYMGVDDSDLSSVEAELDALENRQIELTGNAQVDGLDEAVQGFDDLEQEANETSSALESMAMLDIAGTLNQWGSGAEGFAQKLDNISISTEQLAIQTGMTDSQLTGMINNITNATFPRDEALMYVKSLDQIGVSAQNLGQSATGLDRINDAFHLGAERTNSLGQELSVLGVDMNNVSSSFNALAYANDKTVGGMDNYYTFLRKYDSQFKELGYDVDQASIIIAAATQKYGGGRAALTGLSDALKEADGDTRKLEEALGLQAGTLDNASQITGQYAGQLDAIADAEARHKTLSEQIGAALDDVTASLTGVISPFSSFIGLIGNAGSFGVGINGLWELGRKVKDLSMVDSVKNKFNGLTKSIRKVGAGEKFNTIKQGLITIASKARDAAKAIGMTLWNALKSAATGAKDAAIWIGRTSKELLISAGNAMKSAAAFLWDAGTKAAQTVATKAAAIAQEFLNLVMSMNPIILVVAAIIALIAILWYLYNTNEDVRKAIDGFINTLKNIGETIYGSLKGAFEWLQGAWQNTVDWFNNGVNSIVSAFNTFSQAVQDTAQWIWDSLIAVLEYLQGAWQNTVDFFTNGGQTIQDALGGVFQWLQDAFNNVITFFQTYGPLIAEVLFVMATGGIGAIILLIGQFNGMPSTIGAILQNIITRVINFGSSLVSNFINSAKTSVTNFMNQISSLPAKLKGELDNMLSAVDRWAATLPQKFWEAGVNAVKNFLNALGIHSPGFMAVNFSQELKRMEDSANNNNIASNIGATASNILDKWGDPSLDIEVNGHDGGVTGNVEFLLRQLIELLSNQKASGDFTFNLYGDVDSEERMEKFLDYVIRATEWDNDTAGRGV